MILSLCCVRRKLSEEIKAEKLILVLALLGVTKLKEMISNR